MELIENELLAEPFKALEVNHISTSPATVIDDVAGREKLVLAIDIVAKVRDDLSAFIGNVSLAQAN